MSLAEGSPGKGHVVAGSIEAGVLLMQETTLTDADAPVTTFKHQSSIGDVPTKTPRGLGRD